MNITVIYLGGSRSQSGTKSEIIQLQEGDSLSVAIDYISTAHPALVPYLSSVRWAINHEFATPQSSLSDGDEIALIPPVQGGSPRVLVTEDALDPTIALRAVASDDVGASILFVGTVRNHSRGKDVTKLEYEAYVPMVEKQLERIIGELEHEIEGARLFIAHRYGKLNVGDISIVIAAASAHRDEAYRASRAAIERIKVDVPIFKKELTTDGDTWVGWGGG